MLLLVPKAVKTIRPILRGKDIQGYSYEFSGKYLIATFPSKNYNIEDYPAVENFLIGFLPKLRQTGQKLSESEILQVIEHGRSNGIFLHEDDLKISRKKTPHKWFETQDSIKYWDDFSKQKIVWGNLNLAAAFAIAPEGFFVNAPSPMIVPASKYLLGILNSKLADYFIRGLGVARNGGYFEYKPMFVEQLPIPQVKPVTEYELTTLVEKIEQQELSIAQRQEIQNQIDHLVYELYDLTKDEIKLVESQ